MRSCSWNGVTPLPTDRSHVGPEHAHVEASGVGNNGVLHEVADRAQSGHRRAGGGKRHLPACHCLRATFRAPVSPARLNTSYALIDSASGNVWVANTVGSNAPRLDQPEELRDGNGVHQPRCDRDVVRPELL
jgi:hypothetical protein